MQIKHIFIRSFALSLVRVRILGTQTRPDIKYIILCINYSFKCYQGRLRTTWKPSVFFFFQSIDKINI